MKDFYDYIKTRYSEEDLKQIAKYDFDKNDHNYDLQTNEGVHKIYELHKEQLWDIINSESYEIGISTLDYLQSRPHQNTVVQYEDLEHLIIVEAIEILARQFTAHDHSYQLATA